MSKLRFVISFLAVILITLTARNQDSRLRLAASEGAFMVKAVYVDSQGVKWFGTNRGLCRFDDLTWTYYTDADHLAGNQVNALAYEQTDYGNELWVASGKGVSVLVFDTDGVTGSTIYTTDNGLLDNDVADIVVDSHHGKFFGSAGGLTWFHDGTMDSILYQNNYNYMFNSPVRQMYIYGDTLYLAQDGGIGRFVSGVDGVTGASRWDGDYGILPYSDDIRSLLVKGEEIQYFGCDVGVQTHTGYYAKANWDLLSDEDGLINNTVISIAEDADGGLWFGTQGGVSSLKEGVWTSYTTADGLLNDTVYDMGFDMDGSVWFGTAAGACRLKDDSFQDFLTALPDRSVSTMQFHAYFSKNSGSIHMEYSLEKVEAVSASLYDIRGMLVARWSELSSMPGQNYAELTLPDPSGRQGLFVLQLNHGSFSETKKLLITNY